MRLKRVELIYVSPFFEAPTPLFPALRAEPIVCAELRASSALWVGPGAPQAAARDSDCVSDECAPTRRCEPPAGRGVP